MEKKRLSFFRQSSIQRRILVIVLPSIIIPMLILAAVGFISSSREASKVSIRYLVGRENDLRTIAENPSIPNYIGNLTYRLTEEAEVYRHELELYMVRFVERSNSIEPIYSQIRYVNHEGEEIVKVVEGRIVSDRGGVAETPFFAALKGLTPDEVYSSALGPQMVYAMPIYQTDSGVRGQTFQGAVVLDFLYPLAAFQRTRITIARTFLIITIMSFLSASAIFIMFSSRHITRPISRLLAATQEIARGNFQRKITDAPENELGKLAEGFNSMAENLSTLIKDLEYRNEISRTLISTRNLDETLEGVVKGVAESGGYDRVRLYLYDEGQNSLVPQAVYGMGKKKAEQLRIPLSGEQTGVSQWVFLEKTPYVVEDASRDEKCNPEMVKFLELSSYAEVALLAGEKAIGVMAVDYVRRRGDFPKERLDSLVAFANSAALAIENDRLVKEEAEREHIRRELEVARDIQLSLLPQHDPGTPGFEIVGKSIPAEEVGGDFYSFNRMDGERLGLAIGDVSGKGISAAMLMAVISGMIDSEAKRNGSVSGLIKTVNRLLIPRAKPNKMNSALLYAILDSKEKRLKVANAGEIAPIVCRGDGSECDYMDVKGFPVGMTTIGKYVEKESELESGDTVVLTSDGIVEAMDGRSEMFGFDRLRDTVYHNKDLSAHDLSEKILDEVKDFVGNERSQDDITIVVLKAL